MAPGIVVDSDSHILEPATMWRDYIDPDYRSRAMGIEFDELGLEYLDIDGKMSSGYNGGALGRIAGVEKDREWIMGHATLPYAEAATLAPGAAYPAERIKHLAREGVDKTFLFPSLGLGWEAECEDAEISDAYCRAYNRWLVDFCKDYPDQLYPVAHVSVREVEFGVAELHRAAKDGMKGAFICPAPVNGIRYGDSYYDPILGRRPGPGFAHHPARHLQPQLRRQAPLPGLPGARARLLRRVHGLRRPLPLLHQHDDRGRLRKVPQPPHLHGRNRLHLDRPLARLPGLQVLPFRL